MKSYIRIGTTSAAIAAALMLGSAAYADPDQSGYGAADQTVRITPNTRAVGVYRGETVRFIDTASGQSVTAYIIDPSGKPVGLDQIAPGLPNARNVKAYIWDETGDANG